MRAKGLIFVITIVYRAFGDPEKVGTVVAIVGIDTTREWNNS